MAARKRATLTAVTRLNIVPTAKRYGGEPVPPLRRKPQPPERPLELSPSLRAVLIGLAIVKTTRFGGNS